MAPLITLAEASALGELEDHGDIEAIVERAWRARVERFGDATDMCSLVNAKSGGCAEDCGFCAQSRYAEADTPMHAMMEPEQILEHARAAEAAGAHRFCLVTQGQGLSRRDFEKTLAGVRLVAEHTNLKRCASVGHLSGPRAAALREAGVQRVHHNVETAESYYDEVSTTVRYEGRLRTIDAVREAGLETCVGGILNLGETREQRVEMAFELAALDPTSVPINLLNPRPGTKFGDREPIDPWEAVKWIAIFRLILPAALFRLCGGRVENLGALQPLAVRAGLNGVMMGNFLTTLGSSPEEDRELFTDLGLNVARQPDNGARPRPDNRAGWLDGETPDVVEEFLDAPAALDIRLWDPSTQLRYRTKRSVPARPDGAANAHPTRSADAAAPSAKGAANAHPSRSADSAAPSARGASNTYPEENVA
jgi:biotin synthase